MKYERFTTVEKSIIVLERQLTKRLKMLEKLQYDIEDIKMTIQSLKERSIPRTTKK